MEVKLITALEAVRIGLTRSRLISEGHGAFGESDNSYEEIVYVGKEIEQLSDDDIILFQGEPPNRRVIQVIKKYQCSEKLLELLNPKALERRKKIKYDNYIKLKNEIESDDFYKSFRAL